jgi:hypothetical protein
MGRSSKANGPQSLPLLATVSNRLRSSANLEWIPLLSPHAAGLPQPQGQATGLLMQNGDPSYAANAVRGQVHWLGAAPRRSP